MTLREILDKENIQNVPYVAEYVIVKWPSGEKEEIFSGLFRIENGQTIPMDGDIYPLDEEYEKYELYTADENEEGYFNKGDLCMTVWEKCYE